jgi:hypothetical protein
MITENGWADRQRDPLPLVPPDLAFVPAEDRTMLHHLQQLGRVDAAPQFLSGLRTRLVAQAAIPGTSGISPLPAPRHLVEARRRHRRSWSRLARTAVASVAAASLLASGGLATFFHVAAPAPASAQAILRHAAAALPRAGGDQVVHAVQVTIDNGVLGLPPTKRETWTQLDASGSVVRETLRESTVSGVLLDYYVQEGLRLHTYDARYNVVADRTLSADEARSLDKDPYGVVEMRRLIQSAEEGTVEGAQLQPQQRLGDSAVDVVKLFSSDRKAADAGGTARGTLDTSNYFLLFVDPGTYAIRGVDQYALDAQGAAQLIVSMRVTSSATLASADTPAGTFTFAAPAGARVAAEAPPCTVAEMPLPITVAQAVAEQAVPPLLLSGDAAGLRLQSVTRSQVLRDTTEGLKHTTMTYTYKSQSGATFTVELTSGGPQGPAAAAGQSRPHAQTQTRRAARGQVFTTTTRPMSLTIAGTQVDVAYDHSSGPAQDNQAIDYSDTTTGLVVSVFADGLGGDDFFAAVAALVDGRAHAAVAGQLQREIAASPPAAPVQAPKPNCGHVAG